MSDDNSDKSPANDVIEPTTAEDAASPPAPAQPEAPERAVGAKADDEPAAQPSAERNEVEAEVVEQPKEDIVALAQAETRRMREQMLRIAADFDNFRKRSRRESEDTARRAREETLRELLPVFDNLERAAGHAEQAADASPIAAGVKIVLRQFGDTIGRIGVARINAVGAPFDPNIHEAIQQIETADQAPGTVLAEVLPGYLWGDRLLRASMVVVAKAPAAPPPPDPAPLQPAE